MYCNFFLVEKIRSTPDPETDEKKKKKQALFSNIAAARGAPRHDQRSLSGVYDSTTPMRYAYVLERCSSESEDTTTDILERCISQPEKSVWRCVKSSRENGDDENELGCGIRPKMNVSDRIFAWLATVTTLRSLLRPTEWRRFCYSYEMKSLLGGGSENECFGP